MKALTFQLCLQQAVLVSQAESGEENSAIGLSFIPGSAIRGALVARYLKRYRTEDLATDPRARRLFLGGTVCYLNAYPWHENQRMLPKPLSWFTEKDDIHHERADIFDWAVGPGQPLDNAKSPWGEFCLVTDRSTALYTPSREIDVHISIEDANRRGEENLVYRYDALARNELFAAAIVAPDEADLALLQTLLEPDLIWFGNSLTAGQGQAKIENPAVDPDWQEYQPGGALDSGRVVVTLLSDVIVRSNNGQVDGDLDGELAKVLGMPSMRRAGRFQRLRIVGGFNRKWGLPLAQTWALRAGTVYAYHPDDFDPAALRQAVENGIGERRAEGFGRLAVNWQQRPVLHRRPIGRDAGPEPPPLSPESKGMARKMAGRRLRLLLEERLAEAVNSIVLGSWLPHNTQLSRVRIAAQAALAQNDLASVLALLHNLKASRVQFERARVGASSMYQWIEDRVNQSDVEVQLLRSEALPRVAGEAAVLSASLRCEFTARLIDGVMKKAIKQNQPEEDDG